MRIKKISRGSSSMDLWQKEDQFLLTSSLCLLTICFLVAVLVIICAVYFVTLDIGVAHAADNTGSALSGGAFSTDGDWLVLDSFVQKFKSLAAGSDGTMLSFATSLFGKLILLDFAIAALLNVVHMGEFNETFAMLIGKMFKYGFWMWVITNWTSGIDICGLILKSFSEIGSVAGASGYASSLAGAETLEHPSSIITTGLGYASTYFAYILAPKGILELAVNMAAPFTIVWKFLLACFGAIGILVAFLMIGLNLVSTLIEFYMVSSLGLILIPFSAFDRTEQFGAQNFKFVMGIGIKLMFMAAIIGMMSTTVWATGISSGLSMGDLVNFTSRPGIGQTVLAVLMAWIFAYISCEIPAMAGAALSGSPALSGHNMLAHGIGAAVMVASTISGAGSLAGGAYGVATMGSGSAIGSASQAASAAFKGAGGGVKGVVAGASAFAGSYGSSASESMGNAFRNATTGFATAINEGASKAQDRADKRNYGHYNPPLGYNDNPYMKKGDSIHPEASPINNRDSEYANAVKDEIKRGHRPSPGVHEDITKRA